MKNTKIMFKELFDNKEILETHKKLLKTKKEASKLATGSRQKIVKASLVCLLVSSVACTGTNNLFSQPDLQLVASEEGIQAFYDGIIGTAIAGKHVSNLPETTPYHQNRVIQEGGRTQRYLGWKATNQKTLK